MSPTVDLNLDQSPAQVWLRTKCHSNFFNRKIFFKLALLIARFQNFRETRTTKLGDYAFLQVSCANGKIIILLLTRPGRSFSTWRWTKERFEKLHQVCLRNPRIFWDKFIFSRSLILQKNRSQHQYVL